eukprot:g11378.t1
MVVKRGPPTTASLSFHVPVILGAAEWSLTASAPDEWGQANLNSASAISIGSGHTPPIPCSGIEALHAVVGDDYAAIRSLFVRCTQAPSSISPPAEPPSTATSAVATEERPAVPTTRPATAPADLWVELTVSNIRANSHISSNPALLSSWRLLLPLLVTYTREEARSPPSPAGADSERANQSKIGDGRSGPRDGHNKEGLEVRALEAVYASLKPETDERFSSACVGPAPGASGLNSLPAAVVIKVAHYLPAASLDALSTSCKGQHRTCSALVPGLRLDLFPHQKEGLRWMRAREQGRDARPHPEFMPIDPAIPTDDITTTTVTTTTTTTDSNGATGGEQGRGRGLESDSGEARSTTREPLRAPSSSISTSSRLWLNVVDGMVWPSAPTPCREVRGGLLCDEPGLGKTITVLALLLRTRGLLPGAVPVPLTLSSSSRSGSVSAEEQWNNWGSMERQGVMIKVVRSLQLNDPSGIFSRELDAETLVELGMPDYIAAVGKPIDLQTIARRASSGPRDSIAPYDTFEDFASDIRKVFSKAISYHGAEACSAFPDDSGAGGGDGAVQQGPRGRARAMPAVAEAAEHLSREAEDLLNNVFVARRVDRGEALVERLRALKPSSATLIVVPPPMLPHWRNQLTMHAERRRLGPLFFDERSDARLPPVEELKEYGVNGAGRGHAMGTSAVTSCGVVARLVEAERRWVMTGTPTPTTSADAALRNLSNLLILLREKEYTPEWRRAVRGPFMANRPEGRTRLRRLLSELMIRHTKADLRTIPPPERESALLHMSQQETLAYDTIVSFVRSNLLLTSMEGKTSGWQDSLLNPTNTKYAMEALTNIRLSCCGGGTLIPVVKRHHHIETLDMLRDLHAVGAVDLRRIDNFINRATMGEVSSCQGCGEPLQLLHVTPCAHLVCVDCVDCVTNACRVCGSPYDIDDFQRIQPGFELKWMYNIREQERLHQQRRVAARLARQASTASKNQAASAPASPSSAPDVVVVQHPSPPQPMQPTATTSAAGGGSGETGGSSSSSSSSPWSPSPGTGGGGAAAPDADELYEEEGEELEMHSKAFHTIGQLKSLRDRAKLDPRRGDYRPLKAIVFSQFLPVLNIVGDKFLREFGGYPEKGWQKKGEKCVAEFWGKNRARELERFRTDPECFVLLLGKKGAHGLDLSFVTHMFLMDQIWDRSLETQVVARANRMGAKGSVSVVQLIMKDTMEQELHSYVNSDKSKKPVTVTTDPNAAAASPGASGRPPAVGLPKIHPNGCPSPPRGSAQVAAEAGATPPPSRKTPREKSRWERGGRKRARSAEKAAGKGQASSSSSLLQEHAKVHFLLTSLRSSKAAASAGRAEDKPSARKQDEEGEEEEYGDGGQSGWKGKGKGKGKGKAARRGVRFAEDLVVQNGGGEGGASAAGPDSDDMLE